MDRSTRSTQRTTRSTQRSTQRSIPGPRRRWLVASGVLLGLTVGAGVYVVPRWFDRDADYPYRTDAQRSVSAFPRGVGGAAAVRFDAPVKESAVVAAQPVDALRVFLDGQRDGDLDRAWSVVSERDRRRYPDVVDWQDANGVLPRVLGYTLDAPLVAGERAEVGGTVQYEPRLDDIVGVVPARATAAWVVVRERGGWRVSVLDSIVDPVFPPAAGAVDAARAWADARQQCRVAAQWEGGLVGIAPDSDAHGLCAAAGDVQVGAVRPLDDTVDAEPFLAAFGGDVLGWARVVPVTAPVALDVVLAPIGDRWSVVGVINASTRVSG
jgi:hypothetical protein